MATSSDASMFWVVLLKLRDGLTVGLDRLVIIGRKFLSHVLTPPEIADDKKPAITTDRFNAFRHPANWK
jgi:hypothetical protein